ncbi:MAG: sulfite exporter TauE/SafE family protein [Desulfonauticus sp.]|nr:sulfite exporter TauE/SafE family protein [Desulfonauticus sp.]
MEKIKKRWLKIAFFILAPLVSIATLYAAQINPQVAKMTQHTVGMSPIMFFIMLLIVTTIMGIVAVLAGVGGGVIFTPIMMGFTPIDSYIIRTTGLFVAMAGALVAARPFLKRGITNIRLLFSAAVPYGVCAVIGALLAGYIHNTMGLTGEAFIRGALGIIVIGIGFVFILAGGRTEWPEVKTVDGFTERMALDMNYWEDSLNKVVHYKVTKAWLGLLLFCGVGLISGLFGMGAGWAMVPVFNLVMLVPLKVAATCSKVLISIGDSAAIWPYIEGGGMFPLFAVPCMIGLIVGTIIGTKIMFKIKAGWVRWLIIVIMFFAGIRLLLKAGKMLHWI